MSRGGGAILRRLARRIVHIRAQWTGRRRKSNLLPMQFRRDG